MSRKSQVTGRIFKTYNFTRPAHNVSENVSLELLIWPSLKAGVARFWFSFGVNHRRAIKCDLKRTHNIKNREQYCGRHIRANLNGIAVLVGGG